MKKPIFLFVVSVLSVLCVADEQTGSLVPANYHSPLVDRIAACKGDILTIIVSETSTATIGATTTATKKDSNVIDKIAVPILGMIHIPLVEKFLQGMTTGDNSSNAGTGSTTRTGKLESKLTVVVKDVLPNGNLVIEGNRLVKVNRDVQIYKLTGLVRHDDIRRDNTVLSEKIANAEISTDGKGLIGDRQRRGILTRILDWLF